MILSSYETFAERTIDHERQVDPSNVNKTITVYRTRWANRFDIVLLDEGHKIRNKFTRAHQSVAQLKALVHWFMTATPVNNTMKASLLTLEEMCGGIEATDLW